jgi:hypothetical protein
MARETRVGWPMLTVKTEVNGDSKRTNERGLRLVRWACCAGTRVCSASAAVVGPVQDIFFPLYTIKILLSPSSSKLGRGSCWVFFLFVCVSGCPTGRQQLKNQSKITLAGRFMHENGSLSISYRSE